MATIFKREELEVLKIDSLQYLCKYYGLPKDSKQKMIDALMQKFLTIAAQESNNPLSVVGSEETKYSVRVLRAMGLEEKNG